MKHNPIILMTLLLGLTLFGCKKQEQEILTPKIKNDKVETSATTATFTWTVDWPGKLISVVEVSENEDMSHSQIYGSETETDNHNFTVTVTDLKVATKYYYRYLVWNRYYEEDKFVMDVKRIPVLGALNSLFSISTTSQIRFSKGNLQYIGSASQPYWKFADNQWECMGTTTGQNSDRSDVDRDLFGWGTSGWNNGNTYYRPYDTDGANNLYDPYYGPPRAYGLMGEYANSDWGIYNSVVNGGEQAGLWRTLTQEEWDYLYSTREASTLNGIENARYVEAKVNDVQGAILFPDYYNHPTDVAMPVGINNRNSQGGWYSNTYSKEEWIRMEKEGAVFLPAAGQRHGVFVKDINEIGAYWASSCHYSAYLQDMCVGSFGFYSSSHSGYTGSPSVGSSVRLVFDVN